MPNLKNQATLEKIKADLTDVNAMWVVDFRGLSVKEAEALRGVVREADSTMKVYKNTLMHIALEEMELANLDAILEGPSAFIFSGEDVAASAKALKEFAKANKKLVIKGGMMEGAFVDAAQVEAIASLPSREQLLAQIAGAINGVARGLAVCVNGVPSGLARAIKAVSEQKAA